MGKNIFEGDSFVSVFARCIYPILLKGEWVSYADFMAAYLQLPSKDDLPCNVSKCDQYGELKKAFMLLRKNLTVHFGKDVIEERGNTRSKEYKYVGEETDPLKDMRTAVVINNLRTYWEFCQDSAGFFPTSWIEYFFHDSKDLLDMKEKRGTGHQYIISSIDRPLKNIDLLPYLYMAIKRKKVLSITYQPFSSESKTLTFHPHILKEFNGRWHLFGHAEEYDTPAGYDIAIDRIVGKIREVKGEYLDPPKGYYKAFFDNIIGVSHSKGNNAEDIVIRIYGKYMFGLFQTKPLHHSQKTIDPYNEETGYGVIQVHLEVNNELIGNILRYGSSLEVVSPASFKDVIKNKINEMVQQYT